LLVVVVVVAAAAVVVAGVCGVSGTTTRGMDLMLLLLL
jgi:hypothetical protein